MKATYDISSTHWFDFSSASSRQSEQFLPPVDNHLTPTHKTHTLPTLFPQDRRTGPTRAARIHAQTQ